MCIAILTMEIFTKQSSKLQNSGKLYILKFICVGFFLVKNYLIC